jgi:hypothetical protein
MSYVRLTTALHERLDRRSLFVPPSFGASIGAAIEDFG